SRSDSCHVAGRWETSRLRVRKFHLQSTGNRSESAPGSSVAASVCEACVSPMGRRLQRLAIMRTSLLVGAIDSIACGRFGEPPLPKLRRLGKRQPFALLAFVIRGFHEPMQFFSGSASFFICRSQSSSSTGFSREASSQPLLWSEL